MEKPTSNAVATSPARSLSSILAPVGATAIKPLLAKLSLACRSNQGDELDWRARAALYVEYLSDLPEKFLSEAIDEWIRGNVFFPAISELREIAQRKAESARRQLKDSKAAEARRKEEEKYAKINRPTLQEMAEIKAKIAGLYVTELNKARRA